MTPPRLKKPKNRIEQGRQEDAVTFQIEGPAATDAFVLSIDIADDAAPDAARSAGSRLSETVRLAEAIDLAIVGEAIVTLNKVRPSTLMGSGKVDEIGLEIKASDAEVVIVNAQLTPGQQRNLERAWHAKVLDRTGLILEIFGRRAQTREGTLQVELAHLVYQKSRLVRSWTHLERQRGGSGFLGGPGETQLEADRRVIQNRITKLRKQLASVSKTRGLHRHARTRVPYPIVALVGYTNAGKSTLFNRLTGATVDARDLLFATLDPTMRQIELPKGGKAILSDTVGFISDLPTTLVAAFRATLEEVVSADVILHVRDISHPETEAQSRDVHAVLDELGLDEQRRDAMIEVWNKTDLLEADQLQALIEKSQRADDCCLVSAVTGEGLDQLLERIKERLTGPVTEFRVDVPATAGADIAWLYEHGDVQSRDDHEDGSMHFRVTFAAAQVKKARQRFGDALHDASDKEAIAAE
ncbi:MAG: GTPase HflX [Hyphomicrobiales bacterium]|nr:GTPase HflX [Hyphomicrobiales bacterium]